MNANPHVEAQGAKDGHHGPKYQLDIDGTFYPWNQDTITTEQIAELAGWPAGTAVVAVDEDQNEVTLQPLQSVEIKPGLGFSKKVKFKRG